MPCGIRPARRAISLWSIRAPYYRENHVMKHMFRRYICPKCGAGCLAIESAPHVCAEKDIIEQKSSPNDGENTQNEDITHEKSSKKRTKRG